MKPIRTQFKHLVFNFPDKIIKISYLKFKYVVFLLKILGTQSVLVPWPSLLLGLLPQLLL